MVNPSIKKNIKLVNFFYKFSLNKNIKFKKQLDIFLHLTSKAWNFIKTIYISRIISIPKYKKIYIFFVTIIMRISKSFPNFCKSLFHSKFVGIFGKFFYIIVK